MCEGDGDPLWKLSEAPVGLLVVSPTISNIFLSDSSGEII